MKKNEIFTFKDSNGVEVTGITIACMSSVGNEAIGLQEEWLCYGQNKLFTVLHTIRKGMVSVGIDEFGDDILEYQEDDSTVYYGYIICENCIIPELDKYLEDYLQ